MRKALLVAMAAAVVAAGCSPSRMESAARDGEWGCLAGTAAGAVAGAVVGSFFAKGLGGGNVARTLTGVGGGAGGAALGQNLACR
jgi:hypothetical protein